MQVPAHAKVPQCRLRHRPRHFRCNLESLNPIGVLPTPPKIKPSVLLGFFCSMPMIVAYAQPLFLPASRQESGDASGHTLFARVGIGGPRTPTHLHWLGIP